ncbi:hypothetical protein ACFP81_01145 [Deinococcus lacus]|uniref:Uncharacterized protein n=1 Tax=Deinococcus lacus TaxID=392561 RepID=A0ABW1YC47_9DEIO
MTDLDKIVEKLQSKLLADRKVRAVAQAGSYGGDDAWPGSVPTLIAFERGILSPQTDTRLGATVLRYPYERLEEWRDWEQARQSAPLGQLATSRVVYDPTGHFGRIQRMLWTLSDERLAEYRGELLRSAEQQLRAARDGLGGPAQAAEQLAALTLARRLATEQLYPALLTHARLWPEFELRLPHAWRAAAGLKFPKGVYWLEQLYGFGGHEEARRTLLATRGLKMLTQEKHARAAIACGYYDGAVRYLRDEAARLHAEDLSRWAYLSSARRERLGTLLGVTRSPLGPAALQIAGELLVAAREGE